VTKNIFSDKVTVPNGELYLEKIGEGKPLILIHAGFSDRRDWIHQLGDFGKKYYTITYDQRGSGNSSVIKSGFSPADDLKAVMDHLKIKETYLVGHSIGGTIAIDFALRYPKKVSALVLVASGLNGYSWSKEYLDLMNAIWGVPEPEEMTKKFLSAPFYAVSINVPKLKYEIEEITKENFQKVLRWETFDAHDIHWFFPEALSKVKELKIPVFVIYGDKDSEDIKKISDLLNKNIQNVKIAQIKNADHFLNFENPRELNKLVLDFLSDLSL
jgi:pimeloyl-ACP methyl ester carboxylesterase